MSVAVYPGQGAQSVGMGRELYENFKVAAELFEEASDALSINCKRLLFEGPEDELQLTANTQPALLLVSVAAHRVLQTETNFSPKAASGHSVGEYAALVGAGVLPFSTAIRAVRRRGEAMQTAVPIGSGGMTAVLGLDFAQIQQLCAWATKASGSGPLEPANLNAPGQIVISGNKMTLEWLSQNYNAEAAGLTGTRTKLIPLKVSAPFHCSMMTPAENTMREYFENIDFAEAQFPVVQNVHGRAVTKGTELKENLIRQISAPVRWIECVRTLESYGTLAVELGSGKVLSGLIKKISETLKPISVTTLAEFKEASQHEL